jgi:hypothetical protein
LDFETHGPLGTLWVGLALGGFYIALTWINVLLGGFLTPLFIIPMTWLQDRLGIGVPRRRPEEIRNGATPQSVPLPR